MPPVNFRKTAVSCASSVSAELPASARSSSTVPRAMMRPLRMMLMRSHISSATSSVCVLIRMATPFSLMRRNTALMRRAPRGSRPTIGSSTSTARGRCRNAAAHDQALLHAVREALDELVLPAGELEDLEHLLHAIGHGSAVHPIEPAVKAQELARGELLVDERPVRDEPEGGLGGFRAGRQVVAVHELRVRPSA